MRHQLLCSGSQWGHLGDQEIGRDGQEETGGRWWYSFLSSPNSHSTSPQGPHSERQRDDPCCYFVSPWPEEPESLQTFSFLLPSILLPLSGMSCPIFSPSQGVSRKYFQILTPLSGDTAGVNHVNVNFHEFHIKYGPALLCSISSDFYRQTDRRSQWAS